MHTTIESSERFHPATNPPLRLADEPTTPKLSHQHTDVTAAFPYVIIVAAATSVRAGRVSMLFRALPPPLTRF